MFAPLAAVIALFLLWSGYWYAANSTMQAHAISERAQLAARGFSLACARESWGGYPFRFEFSCTNPTINFPGGQTARSGALLVVAQAYNPAHAIALINGPSEVALPDSPLFPLSHGKAVISITAQGGNVQISAEIPDFNGAGILAARNIEVHWRSGSEQGNNIAVTVESAVHNTAGKPPLTVDSAQLLGSIAANRELRIGDIQFTQSGLKLWGQGAVALDGKNRIAGRIAAQTNDLGRLLTVLDPHIELAEQDRATLKAVLGLLGKETKADLVAVDGNLYIGPVKIGELTPLY
jgi:hypothetical protein